MRNACRPLAVAVAVVEPRPPTPPFPLFAWAGDGGGLVSLLWVWVWATVGVGRVGSSEWGHQGMAVMAMALGFGSFVMVAVSEDGNGGAPVAVEGLSVVDMIFISETPIGGILNWVEERREKVEG